ncbi:MAG TPA: hypothetical protein VMF61_00030 [Candidatus Acidoferrales bacterium]|nr:hypothetical protein [Candidatus Acidoferrales bacterium]
MSKRVRLSLWLLLAAAIPIAGYAGIQQQRGQIQVNIEIDVTPAPLALRTGAAPGGSGESIVARSRMVAFARPAGIFHAESLSFVPGDLVAQTAAQQKSVRVDAEVSPNPNATLLTSNNCNGTSGPCNHIAIPVTAGQTTTVTCAYQIAVTTTETSWTLDHGLFTDFENGSGTVAFDGKLLYNNTHAATPIPYYTPFVVFSDDGGVWASVGTGIQDKTYCVDLQITVPASVAQGSYYSNATYTLYY